MDPSKADRDKSKLLKNCLNLKNESSSGNALTYIAGSSNVRSTSVKLKESTENILQKRTISPSREGNSIKRLKQTSTSGDHSNGVTSTSKINPTIKLERCDREVNMAEPNSTRSTTTPRNKSHELSDTSTTSSQDLEQTVNPKENKQNVLQTSQNTNNVGDDLIDVSIRIITDDDTNDAEIIDGPSTPSLVGRRTIENSREERTSKCKENNEKYPETPKTTATVLINEEENNGQIEVASEGPRICPICLDSLKDKEVFSTICGHIFCIACIFTVFETTKECPFCRTLND